MSNEEIKADCELQYKAISDARLRLKQLRAACNHEKTFEGNYSWRAGSIEPATICSFCGECIKINSSDLSNKEWFEWTQTLK